MVIFDVVMIEPCHWALLRTEWPHQVVIAEFASRAQAMEAMRASQDTADEALEQ
ncbi:MAG: hypothetical protein ACJ740_09650 [Gaiellales bacterium]